MADGEAVRVALAYHEAWTSHDLERAMSYVADDIVCDGPAGRLTGAGRSAASWARSRRSCWRRT
jgi:hypothetical protein